MRAPTLTAAIPAPEGFQLAQGNEGAGRGSRMALAILALTPAFGFAAIGLRAIVTLLGGQG
jgi:hypothetical protein